MDIVKAEPIVYQLKPDIEVCVRLLFPVYNSLLTGTC
jgi:hypothetical protein